MVHAGRTDMESCPGCEGSTRILLTFARRGNTALSLTVCTALCISSSSRGCDCMTLVGVWSGSLCLLLETSLRGPAMIGWVLVRTGLVGTVRCNRDVMLHDGYLRIPFPFYSGLKPVKCGHCQLYHVVWKNSSFITISSGHCLCPFNSPYVYTWLGIPCRRCRHHV